MSSALALDWFKQMLWVSILTAGPVVLAAVVVGLLVAIVQAATQVNDQTVAFAPKALAVIVALVVSGSWMLEQLVAFTSHAMAALGHVAGR